MQTAPELILERLPEVSGLDSLRRRLALNAWEKALEGALHSGRPLPILDRIFAPATALVVVDMQEAFLAEGSAIEVPAGREIVDSVNALGRALRDAGGYVFWLRYLVGEDPGLLGLFEGKSYIGPGRVSPMRALQTGHPEFALFRSLEVRETDTIVDKRRYSAVLGSDLNQLLRAKGIRNVIVGGVTTDVCAGNTAECLMQLDYHVVVLWDGTAALDRLQHELTLARLFCLYGDVMPTEEVLARLAAD